jgi:hypothetical protein
MESDKIAAAMAEICSKLKAIPKLPEAFGKRDDSPHVNHFDRIASPEDAVKEADRTMARNNARKQI